MVTQDEETQAKEFLKRAEIRTMKKDLRALREGDALKERDKIVKLKTLEEQLEEKKTAEQSASAKMAEQKAGMEEVLTRNEGQERIAEKDLKKYATEEERQQIFLLESQRLDFEKQIDTIDKEKDPALKLAKNKLLLQKRDQEAKLNSVLAEEKKLEDEEKFLVEKEQTTTIASQKKGLEKSKWDLDKKIQEVEKKRWAIEKDIEDTDHQINQIDKSSEGLVIEKNILREKVLGADRSLREIYSGVMAREEETRLGKAQEQVVRREALSKSRGEEKEKIQRQQWTHSPDATQTQSAPSMRPSAHISVPVPMKEKTKIRFDVEAEKKQREKFLQDVQAGTDNKNIKN